jgi:2EXR family
MRSTDESAFTRFPDLPIEIRFKVWKLACFVTRNVDIATGTVGITFGEEDGTAARPHYYRSRCLPPALLHVCKESRQEGLKYYKLDFGVDYKVPASGRPIPELTVSSPPRIYINWETHRLCVMLPMYIDDSVNDVCRRIEIRDKCFDNGLRHLATNAEWWYDISYAPFVYLCGALEEIVFYEGRTAYQAMLERGKDQGFGFLEHSDDYWYDSATKFAEETYYENVEEDLGRKEARKLWDRLSIRGCRIMWEGGKKRIGKVHHHVW